MAKVHMSYEEVRRVLIEYASRTYNGALGTKYGHDEEILVENVSSLIVPSEGIIFTKHENPSKSDKE